MITALEPILQSRLPGVSETRQAAICPADFTMLLNEQLV